MKRGPSRAAEALIAFFVPAACREHVVGDLHERYAGPRQYAMEAVRTVPLVILSRIWRTTEAGVLLMEAFVLYLSFVGVIIGLGRMEFLESGQGYLKIAIPAAVALLVLVLGDAYADPKKRSPVKHMLPVVLGIGFAFLSQATLQLGRQDLAVPMWIMLYGGGISLLLVCAIRAIFVGDWPRLT